MVSESDSDAFVSVLNRFGKQESYFSLAMEGYTLSLDFPLSTKTIDLMNRLDEMTINFVGRFYLAKDGRMTKQTFENSETRYQHFRNFCLGQKGPQKFLHEQAKRLGL